MKKLRIERKEDNKDEREEIEEGDRNRRRKSEQYNTMLSAIS